MYINYKKISDRIGYTFSPTESDINQLAYTFLFLKNDKDKALELFIQNTTNYPNSAYAYDSLSDAYKALGKREMAIENLEKALELNPDQEFSKRKLEELLNNQ